MIKTEILSIAALDSSGGAGLNQDIRVSALHGRQIQTCITGITIQTMNGVEAIHPIPLEIFSGQLVKILSSGEIRFIKIGALCCIDQVKILTDCLKKPHQYKVVLDPVIKPTLGQEFISENDIGLFEKILSVVDYITPNREELSQLSGKVVHDYHSAVKAAKNLASLHDMAVLVKGGHGMGSNLKEAFISHKEVYEFQRKRHTWTYSHGTGCAVSMAFTCLISSGMESYLAFEKASRWVADLYDRLNS